MLNTLNSRLKVGRIIKDGDEQFFDKLYKNLELEEKRTLFKTFIDSKIQQILKNQNFCDNGPFQNDELLKKLFILSQKYNKIKNCLQSQKEKFTLFCMSKDTLGLVVDFLDIPEKTTIFSLCWCFHTILSDRKNSIDIRRIANF